jgi:hypothetical protein
LLWAIWTYFRLTVCSLQLGLISQGPNPTGTTSTALSGIHLDLSLFQSNASVSFEISDINSLTGDYNSDYLVYSRITSLIERVEPAAVPEPASLFMFVTGMLSLVGFMWIRP